MKDQAGNSCNNIVSSSLSDNAEFKELFFQVSFTPALDTSLEIPDLIKKVLNEGVVTSSNTGQKVTKQQNILEYLRTVEWLEEDILSKIIFKFFSEKCILINYDTAASKGCLNKKIDFYISILPVLENKKLSSLTFNLRPYSSPILPIDEVLELTNGLSETSDDAVVIIDESCRIIHSNKNFDAVFNDSLKQNGKLSMFDIIHSASLENFSKVRQEAYGNPGNIFPIEIDFIIDHNVISKFLGTFSSRVIGKNFFLIASFNKFYQKKDAQVKSGIFYRLTEASQSAEDLDDLFKLIHELIHDSILAKNFYVALYDSEQDGFRFPYFVDEYDEVNPDKIYNLNPSLTRYVYETGKPLLLNDEVERQLTEAKVTESVGPDSPIWLGVPLKVDNEKIGVIVVQDYESEEAYTEQDLQFLTIISNQIARSIENKKQEVLLQESEQIHRALFDNVPVSILLLDQNLRPVQFNDHFCKMFSLPEDNIEDFLAEKLTDLRLLKNLKTALAGEAVKDEGYFNIDDTRTLYIQSSYTPINLENNVNGVLVLAIDITAQKQTEEKEKEKAAYLDNLIESTPEAIAIVDNKNTVIRINHAFRMLFGVDDDDIVGSEGTLLIPDKLIEENEYILDCINQGDKCVVETQRLNKDGKKLYTALSVNPIIMDNENIGSYWSYRDITRKKWNERLQSSHLEIMRIAVEDDNLTDFLSKTHKIIDEFMEAPNFYVCLFNADQQNASFPYHADKYDKFDQNKKYDMIGSLTDYVRRNGRPLQVIPEIIEELAKQGKIINRIGNRAKVWMGIPLITRQERIGVAAIQSYSRDDFYSIAEQDAFELFANNIAVAIEKIKITQELKRSEERYRQLINYNPVAIFHVNREFEITFVNESFLKTFDAVPEDYIGLNLSDLKDQKSIPYMNRAFEGEFTTFEGEYISTNTNKKLWIEAHYSPITNADGQITGILCVFIDLTDRKEAEVNITHQKAFLEQLLQNAPEAIIIVNPQNKIQDINLQFTKLFGFLPSEAIGKEINELIVPPFMLEEAQKIDRIGLASGMINTESIRKKKDGTLIDVKILASPVMVNGKPIAHYGIYHDISAQKKIEQIRKVIFHISQATNQSENLESLLSIIRNELFTILDTTNFSIATYNHSDDTFTYLLNDDSKDNFDANISYSIPNGITEMCYKANKPMWLTKNDIVPEIEKGNLKKYGTIPELWFSVPLRVRDKALGIAIVQTYNNNHRFSVADLDLLEYVSEYIASAIDLRLTHDALAEEKEKLSVTLSSLGEGVITTDVEGKILLMNKTAETILGWTINEAFSEDLEEVLNITEIDESEEFGNPVFDTIKSGNTLFWPKRIKIQSKNGIDRFIAGNSAPIFDRTENIIGVVNVLNDVTDQIMMEDELLRARKLESVALLAGGIAHDFNNILQGVTGNLSIATYLSEDREDDLKNTLIEAEKATIRARELTLQLLTFSKGGNPVRESASIVQLIRETTEFALTGSNVRPEFNFHPDLWQAHVDKGQFNRVIQNLVINADQAMPGGGLLKISAVNVTLMDESSLPLPKGKYVQISVSDEGVGIPQESISKIFDPYFTTKDKGNGLGLATTFSIVRKHDGYITVRSTVGKGTSFVILLPAVSISDAGVDSDNMSEDIFIPPLKILVMDDEEIVLKVAAGMLKLLGHQTTTCYDGNSAIKLYMNAFEAGESYDLIITDLTIPGGLGGVDTVEYLRKYDPDLCAIASSGYSNNPVLSDFESYGYAGIASKPYTINDLEKSIQRVACKIKRLTQE